MSVIQKSPQLVTSLRAGTQMIIPCIPPEGHQMTNNIPLPEESLRPGRKKGNMKQRQADPGGVTAPLS